MDFFAGFLGGSVGQIVSHPFDVLRTRQATNNLSVRETFRGLTNQGLINLFSGVYTPTMTIGAWKCVVLGLYKKISPVTDNPEMRDVIFASAIAGAAGGSMLGPIEVVKVRAMCADTSSSQTLLQREIAMARTLKLKDVCRMSAMLALRDSYATVAFLGAYEYLLNQFQRRDISAICVAGATAGPFGWLVCHPIEVYRVDAFAKINANAQEGFFERAKRIHATCGGGIYGIRSWYRGFLCCTYRCVIQIPVTMTIFETVREFKF